jgi:hypothetical protein
VWKPPIDTSAILGMENDEGSTCSCSCAGVPAYMELGCTERISIDATGGKAQANTAANSSMLQRAKIRRRMGRKAESELRHSEKLNRLQSRGGKERYRKPRNKCVTVPENCPDSDSDSVLKTFECKSLRVCQTWSLPEVLGAKTLS